MLSIIVPAFNEADGIEALYQRVRSASEGWDQAWELIVVDDGSQDRTLEILERIAVADSRLKVVSLSRNFGHQPAVTAGLHHATGSIVCIMDADLQDPPEALQPFFDKIGSGFDVVYAIRTHRKEGVFKRAAYHLYYRMLRRLAAIEIPLDAGDFCVMTGDVARAINNLPERNRFVRGLRTWVGFRQTGLAYERAARFAGSPKYNFRRLLRLAGDGVINFSYRPLQVSTFVGLLVGAMGVLLGIIVIVQYVADLTIGGYNPRQARGWTSLMLVLLFSSAVQLFCLGILGEYLGRLFEETKRRPVYVVKKRIGLDPPAVAG